MRRYLPAVVAIFVPLVGGLALSFLFESGILANRLVVGDYAISFSGLSSRLGIVAALLAAGGAGILLWVQQRVDDAQQKAQEEQAAARRRFLQRLDHELKNPLTIIRLGIANLQQSPLGTGEQEASLARIGEQVQRLRRLIVDLRWLAELEERNVERQSVNLHQLLKEVIAMAEEIPEYSRRPVDLTVQQVPWPVAAVWGDRDLLMVVFRNLIDNALKYTSVGDRVEVRAFDDGQAAVVEIADTGSGIPDREFSHIFEELYRGENARSVSGSGLGLALVQRIVALHGGTVALRSRVGHGTAVTIRLPLVPETS